MKSFKSLSMTMLLSFVCCILAVGSLIAAESPVINLDPDNENDHYGISSISPNFEAIFAETGEAVYITDTDATLTDTDSNSISWLMVANTTLYSGDVLAADTTGTDINAVFNASTGVLSLTGTDTLDNYQKVLRTITFQNTAQKPNQSDRVIKLIANDGTLDSSAVTTYVKISQYAATFREDKGSVILETGATLDDDEGDLASAKLTITNVKSDDHLSADVSGTENISVSYNSSTGILILSGEDSIANYQDILANKIAFENISQNPDQTDRVVTMVINDGTSESDPAIFLIDVVAANDAPVNTLPGAQITNKNTAKIFSNSNGNLISINDIDAGSKDIQITINADYGTLNVAGNSGAQVGFNGTSDIKIIGTVSEINTELNGLTYTPPTDWSGNAVLTIVTNDLGNTGTPGELKDTDTISVTVTSTDSPNDPVANAGITQSVDEGDTVTLDGSGSYDSDGNIVTYQWSLQTSGVSVSLSNPNSARPTFTAPSAGVNGITLTFNLTVTDDSGAQGTDTVEIEVLPIGVIDFTTSTGKKIEIKVEGDGNITRLVKGDTSNTSDKMEDLPYGLIDMEFMVDNPGDTVTVILHLPQAAASGYHWYKYNNNNWSYYSDTVFNSDRTEVTLTLQDGGEGDSDGVQNGVITDMSGLGKEKTNDPPNSDDDDGGDDGETNGCFIGTVAEN